jgi:hypothetical protein
MEVNHDNHEIEIGLVNEESFSDVPVASLITNTPSTGDTTASTSCSVRPPSLSTQRSNGAVRTNPLAPPVPRQQNHQFLDDGKAATINRLLQVTGFLAFVNTIIAICLAAIVGVDVIIGVVLGGIAAGIAGMFVSCGFQHLRSFQIRTAVVIVFSVLAMACALAEYVALSKVEACAVLTTKGSSAYEYYGQAKYFVDAQTCAASDNSPGSHCNCVSDQQDCLRISFSGDCNSVLNKAPQLAVSCVVVSMAQFGFALLALIRLILSTCTCFKVIGRVLKRIVNSMGYEPLPVPESIFSSVPASNNSGTSRNSAVTRPTDSSDSMNISTTTSAISSPAVVSESSQVVYEV